MCQWEKRSRHVPETGFVKKHEPCGTGPDALTAEGEEPIPENQTQNPSRPRGRRGEGDAGLLGVHTCVCSGDIVYTYCKRTVKPPVHLLLEASFWVRTDFTYSALRCRVSFRPGTGPNVQHPADCEPLGQGTAGSHARAPRWVGPPCEHPNVC